MQENSERYLFAVGLALKTSSARTSSETVSFKAPPLFAGILKARYFFLSFHSFVTGSVENMDRASSSVRPKIIWGRPNAFEIVVRDDTWYKTYTLNSPDSSVVTVKAGNKPYILSGEGQSIHVSDRTIVSESALLKKYRYILFYFNFCFVTFNCTF